MRIEERVQRLEDLEAIKRLRYEYARCLDDRDFEAWIDLFTADATCSFEGWGEPTGTDELREFIDAAVAPELGDTAHVMHHPTIDLDGDTGAGTWYVEIYYTRPDEGTAGWRQGRYVDEYRTVGGEWRFSGVSHTFFARQRHEYTKHDDERFGEIVDFGAAIPDR